MALTTGQQAALFTIALVLVGIGAISSATLTQNGLPPVVSVVTLVAGIVGAALIKGYGLAQQTSLAAKLRAISGGSSGTPETTKA